MALLTLFRRSMAPDRSESPSASLASMLRARDSARLRRYRDLLDFYEGRHFASQRRGRSSLVVNYARTVVDKGVSYLFGRGVRVSVPPQGNGGWGLGIGVGEADSPADQAEAVLNWIAEENDLDLVLLQAATNASVLGDAVLKVFWDRGVGAATGRVRVVNVDPFRVFPTWASDDLGTLREVALTGCLTAAEADERYGGWERGGSGLGVRDWGTPLVETVEIWTAASFRLIVAGQVAHDGPNPYGFIPFVHVANLPPPNTPWGVSDLTDLIPLNRELDLRMSDQADVIRYHADPPVVFRGVEEHSDLPVGPGTVWDLPRDADVSLLEWRGQMPAVEAHLERVMRAMYDVTETPRTAFGDSGRLLSGVALETELQPLIQRTLRKRVAWTSTLRQCHRMALLLMELADPGLAPGAFAPYRSQVLWPPILPRDDDADARRNLALVEGGLRSHRQAMEELGEQNAEQELRRVREDRAFLVEEGPHPSLSPISSTGSPTAPRERSSESAKRTGQALGRGGRGGDL